MNTYLSNHWHDVTLLKLDPSPGSEGPFIVVQDAMDSDDPTQTRRVWLLRNDGFWVDLAVQLGLPEDNRAHTWFENIHEVMAAIGALPPHPQVFYHELTGEERIRSIDGIEHLNLERIHERVIEWKEAREQ